MPTPEKKTHFYNVGISSTHGVLLDYFTKKNRTGACCMFLESPDPTGFKKCEIEIPAVRFFFGWVLDANICCFCQFWL